MNGGFTAGLACLVVSACLGAAQAQAADSLAADRSYWWQKKVRALEIAIQGKGSAPLARSVGSDHGPDHEARFGPAVNRLFLVISGTPALRPTPVGMFLRRSGGVLWPECSAILARHDTVLTARHCIDRPGSLQDAAVFFPLEGTRRVSSNGVRFPCEEPGANCDADVAMLELSHPYRLLPLAHRSRLEDEGRPAQATAVGFGASNLLLGDRGLMHEGRVTLAPCGCDGSRKALSGELCFHLDYGPGSGTLRQWASFGGDSGGALFAGEGAAFELLGLSTGFDRGCTEGMIEGRYVDLRTNAGLEVLDGILCDQRCTPANPPAHEVLLAVELAYVTDAGEDRHPIRVGDGATELLVNLNHETAGFQPEPATDLSIVLPAFLKGECSRYYGVESCHISNPPPGAYSIGIQRESGNPAYQLTVVAIYEE